jgi:hypothetical protein
MDLDQSGHSWQIVKAYLGPSLGWVECRVNPSITLTAAQTYNVQPGDSIIFVQVAGNVIINLPDVRAWVQETAYIPATGFERAVVVKDLGNAAFFPIIINPFGTQSIDALAQPFTIYQNRQLVRFFPFNDMSGWYSG